MLEIERRWSLNPLLGDIEDLLRENQITYNSYYIEQYYNSNNERIIYINHLQTNSIKYIKTIKTGEGIIREENEETVYMTGTEFRNGYQFYPHISKDRYVLNIHDEHVKEMVIDHIPLLNINILEIEFFKKEDAVLFNTRIIPECVFKYVNKEITDKKEASNYNLSKLFYLFS